MKLRFLPGLLGMGMLGLMVNVQPSYAEQPLWSTSGFEQPESVCFDQGRDQIYVSNINGAPNEANGKGYISLLSANGKILKQKWITGLDAPKGMAVFGHILVVSDLHRIHKIDIEKGIILQSFNLEGAKFLNDVTVSDEGVFYITDMFDDAIYALSEKGVSLWLKAAALSNPNGIFAEKDSLYVGSWGIGVHDDFTTDVAGSLLQIDMKTKAIHPVKGGEKLGNIDGVTRMNGQLVVNDWITGKLYGVNEQGQGLELASYKAGLADISSRGQTLYMPYMLDNKVEAIILLDK